jgi:D-alanine-D-alanine ligase
MKFIDEETLDKIKNKRICLLTGTGKLSRASKLEMLAEEDTEKTSHEILETLLKNGYKHVDFFTVTEENLPSLKFLEPDVFFNLTEGERSEFCNLVFRTIYPLGIPITGTSDDAMEKTTNKHIAKMIMEENHIPTPPGMIADTVAKVSTLPENMTFPLIIKPVYEDGSTGIHQKSVVENQVDLEKITAEYLKEYNQPVLIEKYIESREFSPTIFTLNGKTEMLPLTEVIYDETNKRKWNISCYKSKWQKSTEVYKKTSCQTPPLNLPEEDYEIIRENCVKVFELFKIGDYARFDIRYDLKNHIPYFLDLNANPSLEDHPMYALSSSVHAANLTISEFIALIIKSAIERFGKKI